VKKWLEDPRVSKLNTSNMSESGVEGKSKVVLEKIIE
jgi:hypothetical protein